MNLVDKSVPHVDGEQDVILIILFSLSFKQQPHENINEFSYYRNLRQQQTVKNFELVKFQQRKQNSPATGPYFAIPCKSLSTISNFL